MSVDTLVTPITKLSDLSAERCNQTNTNKSPSTDTLYRASECLKLLNREGEHFYTVIRLNG